ncbi:MAG: hypothetical protein ACKPKO_63345, partial [Candidatus Fonsibacter sp.]
MFKQFKKEWPYYLFICVLICIATNSLSAMLLSPLTLEQVNDIKTKITAYNLELVSIKDKQLLGCGNGHFYRVPVNVK